MNTHVCFQNDSEYLSKSCCSGGLHTSVRSTRELTVDWFWILRLTLQRCIIWGLISRPILTHYSEIPAMNCQDGLLPLDYTRSTDVRLIGNQVRNFFLLDIATISTWISGPEDERTLIYLNMFVVAVVWSLFACKTEKCNQMTEQRPGMHRLSRSVQQTDAEVCRKHPSAGQRSLIRLSERWASISA